MYFYSSCEVYEGDWGKNQRSGWGRMYYECGDIYEGEWVNDKKEGQGIIRYGTLCCFWTEASSRTKTVLSLKMRLISPSKWKLVWRRLAGWRQERKREVLLFGQRPDLRRHLGGRSGQVRSSVWLRQGRSANAHAVSDPKGWFWDRLWEMRHLQCRDCRHNSRVSLSFLSCGWTTWTRSWGRPRQTFWSDWRKNGTRINNKKNHDGQRSPRATDTNKWRISMQQVWFQNFFFFFFCWHPLEFLFPGMFRRSRSVFSRIVGGDMLVQRLLQLCNSLFTPPQSSSALVTCRMLSLNESCEAAN